MRKALLALLLVASPAWSAPNRIAVFQAAASNGAPAAPIFRTVRDLLDRGGQAYDEYNVAARTWNLDRAQTGKADSTWFRERYSAIVVPYLDGGTGSILPTWGASFQDSAGNAGIQQSPLCGRWTIATYVLRVRSFNAATVGSDETANNWVPGVRVVGGNTYGMPTVANRGTWGFKQLCRFRATGIDTFYTASDGTPMFVCKHGSADPTLSARSASLAWMDSTVGGWACTAGDTFSSAWRFRPNANRPGITYTLLPTNRLTNAEGALIGLQMCYAQTDAEPQRRIVIPLVIHNDYAGGSLNATAKIHVAAIHDTLLANGIPWSDQLSQTSSSDYAGVHDANTRSELRRVLVSGSPRVTWAPGSNNAGHGFGFYTAAETTEVRKAFNADMNTATSVDSFNLSRSRMSISRMVTPSGQVGAWQSKVLLDAGVRTIESTLATPIASGWALLSAAGGVGQPVDFVLPGDNRVLSVVGTIGFGDGATFSGLRGGGTPENDYVGGNVTQRIGWAAQTYSSIYFHMSTDVTGTDGYWRWFASVLARHFAFYDRVITPVTAYR